MSNVCPRIRKYDGTKSQKILEMIAEKRRKEVAKKLPEIIKDKELNLCLKSIDKINEDLANVKVKLNNRMRQLNIEKGYNMGEKFRPAPFCVCDKLTTQLLQDAQDLHSLGKHTKANELWEAILKQQGLLQ